MKLVDAAHSLAVAIATTNGHPDPEAYAAEVMGNLPADQQDEAVGDDAKQEA